jgi:hypothetical protein
MPRILSLISLVAICGSVAAQSNERGANYDGGLSNIGINGSSSSQSSSGVDYYARHGTYPNGEIAIAMRNELCNPGTVPIEWQSAGTSSTQPMKTDHPKFSFMVAREKDGRFVQISNWAFCKHAFLSTNSSSTCGGTCQQPPNGGAQLGVKCSDVYGTSNNGSLTWLGPPNEINPFFGTWDRFKSYFDIGHPGQPGYPLAADSVRSLSTSGIDAVNNRVVLQEQDIIGVPNNQLFMQIQVVFEGERFELRNNNIMSRPFRLNWSGSTWQTFAQDMPATHGTILSRWNAPGVSLTSGQNGGGSYNNTFDGRFAVAVQVTGPTNGLWHYEYVVHNVDNAGGGGAFRLPVCPTGQVLNLGFRDIDHDPSNDWTASVSNGEIAWIMPVQGNAQRWNMMFNFWFDSDVAPVAGNASIDQVELLPGAALSVSVPTQVPGLQPAVFLGGGCGTPSCTMVPNGIPSIGNLAFGLEFHTAPNTLLLPLFSPDGFPSTPLGSGCELFVNLGGYGDLGGILTDGTGYAFLPLPIAVGTTWVPDDVVLQALTFVPNPPLFNIVGLADAQVVRFGGTGCY